MNVKIHNPAESAVTVGAGNLAYDTMYRMGNGSGAGNENSIVVYCHTMDRLYNVAAPATTWNGAAKAFRNTEFHRLPKGYTVTLIQE